MQPRLPFRSTSSSRRRLLAGAGTLSLATLASRLPGVAAQSTPPAASPQATPAGREVPSQEATQEQLTLALNQGAAYRKALEAMQQEATVVSQPAGDYVLWLVAEKAEGLYILQNGKLVWTEPGEANAHLEVAPQDAGDGRFVPGLDVSLALTAPDGTTVGKETIPFVWHPWLYHYGKNWKVPGDGTYRATVTIAPFPYDRHDQTNGNRYAEPVTAEFEIDITTGQK